MPRIDTDWKDLILDAGEDTTGWAVEMHLRTAPGAEPAIKKFSSTLGTMSVAQPTVSGATYGIRMNALKADMNFDAGTYVWNVIRTDGSRNEDLYLGGYMQDKFEEPITNTSLT